MRLCHVRVKGGVCEVLQARTIVRFGVEGPQYVGGQVAVAVQALVVAGDLAQGGRGAELGDRPLAVAGDCGGVVAEVLEGGVCWNIGLHGGTGSSPLAGCPCSGPGGDVWPLGVMWQSQVTAATSRSSFLCRPAVGCVPGASSNLQISLTRFGTSKTSLFVANYLNKHSSLSNQHLLHKQTVAKR
jgi:hypothetical protein